MLRSVAVVRLPALCFGATHIRLLGKAHVEPMFASDVDALTGHLFHLPDSCVRLLKPSVTQFDLTSQACGLLFAAQVAVAQTINAAGYYNEGAFPFHSWLIRRLFGASSDLGNNKWRGKRRMGADLGGRVRH